MLNIIILTYNNFNATRKCLKNLYRYTKDFNVFVFDNASTDETVSYLQKQEKENQNFSFFLSSKNIGIVLGRNESYFLAKNYYPEADYTLFLDNDQYVQGGWQESHFEWIEKGYDIVGVEAWWMKDDFYPAIKRRFPIDEFTYVGCGGMLIRNKVIEDIGLFDKRFSPFYFEDPDFCFRAVDKGYKIAWNYRHKIEHEAHKLLNTPEKRLGFQKSWEKFKEKWKNKKKCEFFMKEE